MSSTPNLPQIQDAIVTAIGGIVAGVGSYNTTVLTASISLVQRDIKAIQQHTMPAVDVAFQGEEEIVQMSMLRKNATWLITGYVALDATEDETAAARQRMLRCGQLRDDIKAALYGSQALHGGVCTFVECKSAMNTSGVAAERDSGGSQGTLRFLVSATYFEPPGLTPVLT